MSYRAWIVTAINEHCTGLNTIDQFLSVSDILRPDARRQTIITIVHQCNSFFVTGDLHNWHHRAESLLFHSSHGMVDIGQHNRRDKVPFLDLRVARHLEAWILRSRVDSSFSNCILDVSSDLFHGLR